MFIERRAQGELIHLRNKFGTVDSEFPYKIPAMALIRLLDITIKIEAYMA